MTGHLANANPANCLPPPDGVIAWWTGDNHTEEAMSDMNGAVVGESAFGQGLVGMAFDFTRDFSGIILPDRVLLAQTNAFTIEAWINPANNGEGTILLRRDRATVAYALEMNSSGELCFSVDSEETEGIELNSPSIGAGYWSHVAAVCDAGGTLQIYQDAVLVAMTNTSFQVQGELNYLLDPQFVVGGSGTHGTRGSFQGRIDELAFYGVALSADQIESIYEAGVSGKCRLPPASVTLNADSIEQWSFGHQPDHIDTLREFSDFAEIQAENGASIDLWSTGHSNSAFVAFNPTTVPAEFKGGTITPGSFWLGPGGEEFPLQRVAVAAYTFPDTPRRSFEVITRVELAAEGTGTEEVPFYINYGKGGSSRGIRLFYATPGVVYERTNVVTGEPGGFVKLMVGTSTDGQHLPLRLDVKVSAADPLFPPMALTRGPYLQSGGKSNMVVRWRTSRLTDTSLRFGETRDDMPWFVHNSIRRYDHLVTLTNLSTDTTYSYVIGDAEREFDNNEGQRFTTAPLGPKPTRIWALGDSGNPGEAVNSVRDSYYALEDSRTPDVWLMLGDNAYTSGSDSEYQEAVFDTFGSLLKTTPLFPTIGNHDAYTTSDGRLPYLDIFTLPTQGEIGGEPSGSERYYSFDYGDIHFVCLDSVTSDRSADGEMLRWLKADLMNRNRTWLIAYWHNPPYSKGSHDSDNILDSGGSMVQMRELALPILEEHGVDLVLCANSHSYERSYLLDRHYAYSGAFPPRVLKDGGDGRIDGTGPYQKGAGLPNGHQGAVYVVAGNGSFAIPRSLDHPAMYVGKAVLGSVVIDVVGNRLDARFLQADGQIGDYFTIVKGEWASSFELTRIQVQDGLVTATWNSVEGHHYRVESTTDLGNPRWGPVSPDIIATTKTTQWTAPLDREQGNVYLRVVRNEP